MELDAFETKSVSMVAMLLVTVQAPAEDIDRIMDAVLQLTPLDMGHYDANAFETASGVERYRPRAGAAAGEESGLRRRPGVAQIVFELADDRTLLKAVVEAVFRVHSYEEPVIRVETVLSCRSKHLDDRENPNRWWNRSGDWAKAQKA